MGKGEGERERGEYHRSTFEELFNQQDAASWQHKIDRMNFVSLNVRNESLFSFYESANFLKAYKVRKCKDLKFK